MKKVNKSDKSLPSVPSSLLGYYNINKRKQA